MSDVSTDRHDVTQVEASILRVDGAAIARVASAGDDVVVVIELGGGSTERIEALLPHLRLAAYVRVDASEVALARRRADLASRWPRARLLMVNADYRRAFELPPLPRARRIALLPGATIGDLQPDTAAAFLGRVRGLVGGGGRIVVGVDLGRGNDFVGLAARADLTPLGTWTDAASRVGVFVFATPSGL